MDRGFRIPKCFGNIPVYPLRPHILYPAGIVRHFGLHDACKSFNSHGNHTQGFRISRFRNQILFFTAYRYRSGRQQAFYFQYESVRTIPGKPVRTLHRTVAGRLYRKDLSSVIVRLCFKKSLRKFLPIKSFLPTLSRTERYGERYDKPGYVHITPKGGP